MIAKRALRTLLLLATLGAGACAPRPPEPPLPTPAEVRALWVVRRTLVHPDSVRAMVRRAHAAGFNTLIVQVRGRGDAFYKGRWEPQAESLEKRFDPLALVVREAHRRGISVHAWLNTHLVANADTLPTNPSHVIYTRPEILAVPRPLARELNNMDPKDPGFVEALAEYARENRDHVEGLYTSPAAPEVKEHIYSIWMDILENYDVDGMHFDYVRYPAPEYDYSRPALLQFRRWLLPQLADSLAEPFALLETDDPLVYPDSFPEAWDRFRREQITRLVERIYHGVKQRRPNVTVSAAVFGNAEDAYLRRYQDWPHWLRLGILDVACPMAYTPDTEIFRDQITVAVDAGGGARVWAGIGAFRNTVEGTLEKISVARELGTRGIVLFSYDFAARARVEDTQASYLDQVGQRAFRRP
jgi:uncharacterized lipoprotein YddW (UPF0748 family)